MLSYVSLSVENSHLHLKFSESTTAVLTLLYWQSHQRCSVKNVFLEISQNSQENTKKRKKRLWHDGFPVNVAKLRTLFSNRLPPVVASVHVIPHSLPIHLHPHATSNRVTSNRTPSIFQSKILQDEHSKLTSTWYIHCFKSCFYSNFL